MHILVCCCILHHSLSFVLISIYTVSASIKTAGSREVELHTKLAKFITVMKKIIIYTFCIVDQKSYPLLCVCVCLCATVQKRKSMQRPSWIHTTPCAHESIAFDCAVDAAPTPTAAPNRMVHHQIGFIAPFSVEKAATSKTTDLQATNPFPLLTNQESTRRSIRSHRARSPATQLIKHQRVPSGLRVGCGCCSNKFNTTLSPFPVLTPQLHLLWL